MDEVNNFKCKLETSLTHEEQNFTILRMRPTKNGDILVELPTKNHQEKAMEVIKNKEYQLDIEVAEPNLINPRLIIQNVPADIDSENIL